MNGVESIIVFISLIFILRWTWSLWLNQNIFSSSTSSKVQSCYMFLNRKESPFLGTIYEKYARNMHEKILLEQSSPLCTAEPFWLLAGINGPKIVAVRRGFCHKRHEQHSCKKMVSGKKVKDQRQKLPFSVQFSKSRLSCWRFSRNNWSYFVFEYKNWQFVQTRWVKHPVFSIVCWKCRDLRVFIG